MKKMGEKPEKASWAAMVRFYKRVEAYRRVLSERKEAQKKLARLDKGILEVDAEKKEKGERLASILKECQMGWDGDGERAVREFKEKLRSFRRFVQIRGELIPRARLDQISEETHKNIVSALEDVEASMTQIEGRHPEVKQYTSMKTQARGCPDTRMRVPEGDPLFCGIIVMTHLDERLFP